MSTYAIVATGSFGDVVNTTPVASHLKKLGHEVHWYVASFYKSALENNPDIQQVFALPTKNKAESTLAATRKAVVAAQKGKYAKVISPAPYYRKYWPTQKHKIVDCIRLAAQEDLGISERDWRVPWVPVLRLTEQEKANCDAFFQKLPDRPVVLFEYQAESGQSHLTPSWVGPVCAQFKDHTVVLSGRKPSFKLPPNAVDGSVLSIRESAEAFNRASFMVGVASGITCVCHSTWTGDKVIPWIESCNNRLWSSDNYPRKQTTVVTSPSMENFLSVIQEALRA